MENKEVSGRGGASRRAFLSAGAATAVAAPFISSTAIASASTTGKAIIAKSRPADFGDLRHMINQIDPKRIETIIATLAGFGTRHTASSQTDPNRGIGAAIAYVSGLMNDIAAASGGRMTVQQQTFTQPVSSNIPVPTSITNVIGTLPGTSSPERFYVITGHLDSRCTDVTNFTDDAPGADDDASGVAVVLELARIMSTGQFPGTLVFGIVDGEEQGLYGSTFMAQQMAAAGNDVQGMVSNDIVGQSVAHDGTKPDPHTIRMFSEGIPTNATSNSISLMQSVGGENDSQSRQLTRFAMDVATFDLTDMNIRPIWRRDRYLRGSDHLSFQGQGYPACRMTEPRENFNHEHQNVQVVNGVQLGDLLEYVDFKYVGRVAAVNMALFWSLASGPATPKGFLIHTAPPVGFPGTNLTSLEWTANPDPDLAFYEIVMRETTARDWTTAMNVGNVTSVTLDISKDNLQFGLRAVDSNGHRSPAAFPVVVN